MQLFGKTFREVNIMENTQGAGVRFKAFCAKHEGKINLACNISAYALGTAVLVKSTSFLGIAAGTGLAVIGIVGLTAQGMEYVTSKSGEQRSAGDPKDLTFNVA